MTPSKVNTTGTAADSRATSSSLFWLTVSLLADEVVPEFPLPCPPRGSDDGDARNDDGDARNDDGVYGI